MSERSLSAIVLAAGEGTRMKSSRPKPLHLLAGRTMLQYMLDSLAENNKSLSIQPLILLKKAELSTQKQEFSLADSLLTVLFTRFGDHYLADDALFRCAQINESHLQNTERARKCYEIVFNQYPASIFAAQARQKYRFLRGDK